MDIDEQRLAAVAELCSRYAAEVGVELEIRQTTDRREALAGADFVINAALTAGYDRLFEGWEIAARLGYRHGGSLHVMHDEAFWINFHQLRFFQAVVDDVLELCPSAWVLQVANPVLAGVTYLGRKYPQAKVVGVCHGFLDVFRVADALGLDRATPEFEIPGVNHFVWLTRLRSGGEDMLPRLEAWLEREGPTHWKSCGLGDPLGPKACDLYLRFGALPIGDTGTFGGGSWGWWYHVGAQTEARWRENPALQWDTKFAADLGRVTRIQEVAADENVPVTREFPPELSGEVIIPLIESLACDVPRVVIGNVPNSGGVVPGIPTDFAVESPLSVSGRGIRPIPTTPLPPSVVAHARRDYVAPVNLELQALEEKRLDLLLELILTDPWTRSERMARELLDAIAALPYHQELRHHYS
jgi:alpha-galactosidase